MLLVKTYIGQSKIHGIGLFAEQNIEKGTETWRFHPCIDIVLTKQQVNRLPSIAQDFIREYGSLSKLSNKYIISSDNTRFTNHSSSPNLDTVVLNNEPEAIAVASKDISKGEEMTVDYRSFDQSSVNSNKEYLK